MPQLDAQRFVDILFAEKFRIIAVLVTLLVAWCVTFVVTPYQEVPQTEFYSEAESSYLRAEVISLDGNEGTAKVLDGPQEGKVLPVYSYGEEKLRSGSTILISSDTTVDEPNTVAAVWRFPVLVWMLACMIVAAIFVGGRQGAKSLLGLGASIAVVIFYIIPQVLDGANALAVSAIGAFVIATLTILLGHSFAWRTIISLACIYVILCVVILLAWISGWAANLTGIYDETSSYLGFAPGMQAVDLYGVLLGGIIIASLGVLDDVVTTQVAAVDEFRQLKSHASWKELFSRGMSVGREHLSAVINTLALAYVGVALPTILTLSQTLETSQDLLMTLNYEYLSVEVIRLVISTLGIIVAIPLSTGLAVWLIGRKQQILAILRRLQPKLRR